MAVEGGEGAGEYITHHLTNWCWGCNPQTHQPNGLVDFHAFNLDVILMSVLLAAGLVAFAWFMRRRWSAGKPGRLQYSLEFIIEYIGDQIREVFPKANNYVGAMALTIFVWVFLMNAMDLIPIDLIPSIVGGIHSATGAGTAYFRDVPTATLDVPFAMAIVIFVLMVVYQIRVNGPGGYAKRFLFHPYGKFGAPMNIVTTLIDDLAKPVSLALRLFGNMFAGELIFALLALLTLSALQPPSLSAVGWIPANIVLGIVWTVFDLLIATLQAFIFGVLAIVYLGMAQQTADH
ncbi:MAG TPA: F0F1 ATP synthase subunit A [Gammaproteobacteria bacterium]|nr:F0F1 ATP synthase subunit A [Gammaproteobacteria bacterium]